MPPIPAAVRDFLQQKRIAIAGVSHTELNSPGNMILRKLAAAGYTVYAVNPRADEIESRKCFHDLNSIGEPVDGVVITAPPAAAESLVQDCARLGIRRVWMHRSFGKGSVSHAAAQFCRENGIQVIAGGCPMMYCEPVDTGHKCVRWLLRITGGLPS